MSFFLLESRNVLIFSGFETQKLGQFRLNRDGWQVCAMLCLSDRQTIAFQCAIALFQAAAMLSPRRTKAFFFARLKLVFKFFTARLDRQNVLCLCKTAAA